jgi:hypothetical protein
MGFKRLSLCHFVTHTATNFEKLNKPDRWTYTTKKINYIMGFKRLSLCHFVTHTATN